MPRIASFDIFDTLLVRTSLEPTAILEDVGRELIRRGLWVGTAIEFKTQRMQAERRAMQFRGRNAVALAEIYDELAHDWPTLDLKGWGEIEIEVERLAMRAVPGALERLNEVRRSCPQVIFLSDMYLPGDTLTQWLREFGFWAEGDRCFISCELRASKAEGTLYHAVKKQMPAEFVHHGNDENGDVLQARKAGWLAEPWLEANHSRSEHAAIAGGLGPIGQNVFGAARLARLSVRATGREAAYRDLAAGVLLPTLTAYAFWILAKAKADGVSRLYCLSRDGFLLARLLPLLAKKFNIAIDVRYLHGSRQAWHLPGLTALDEPTLDWLFDACEGQTLSALLVRVQLDLASMKSELTKNGLAEKTLTGQERPALTALLREPSVTAKILASAAAAKNRLHQYLRQHSFGDGVPSAMIDLGWFGRCRRSFRAATRELGTENHQWYFFGLLRSEPGMAAYFYDFTRQIGLRRGNQFNGLLETLCLADHGTVRGYTENGDPICAAPDPQAAWQLPIALDVMEKFVHEMDLDFETALREDLRPAIFSVLERLYHHPTKEELGVWHDFDYSNEQSGLTRSAFVQPYHWKELPGILARGEVTTRSPAVWTGGSWLASGKTLRMTAKIGLAARNKIVSMVKRFP